MHIPTCFISYCHDGLDEDAFSFFLSRLNEKLQGEVHCIHDGKLRPGDNLPKFMERVNTVDAVVVVLTPEYARRIERHEKGVYFEFSRAWSRYLDARSTDQETLKQFALIPVILTGTIETSVPAKMRSEILCEDLARLNPHRTTDGELRLAKAQEADFATKLDRIAEGIRAVATMNSEAYGKLYSQYFHELFYERKAAWSDPTFQDHAFQKRLLVRTRSYERVREQQVWFLIGRKGSGKSTIAENLPLRETATYMGSTRIYIDTIRLDPAYASFTTMQARSDLGYTVSQDKCFRFAWTVFIYLCVLDALVRAHSARLFPNVFEPHLNAIRSFVTKVKHGWAEPEEEVDAGPFFTYSYSQALLFIEHCIEAARSERDSFLSDIEGKFNQRAMIEFSIGSNILKSVQAVLSPLRKKIILTIDGFDSAFDQFRRATLDGYHDDSIVQARAAFEVDWLRALLGVIMELRLDRTGQSGLSRKVDFCVTIPRDRFDEVRRQERDSFRFEDRYSSIQWSGIELAIMLRKRLEVLSTFTTSKNPSIKVPPERRLSEVLNAKFRHVPTDLRFDFNGRSYTLPLFLYVLRHTFWRPREVLHYYCQILAMAEEMRKKEHPATVESVRRAVKVTTLRVVTTEFLREFEVTVPNIEEVVGAFRGAHQVQNGAEVEQRLAGVPLFFAASGSVREESFAEKVKFLYDVGFIGLQLDQTLCDRIGVGHCHAFQFNEGRQPLSYFLQAGLESATFVVHPAFCEYLQLRTDNIPLVSEYTWHYLHESEIHRNNFPEWW